MKKRNLISIVLLLVLLLGILPISSLALDEPALNSKKILLIDTASERTLIDRMADARAEPASLTKIMTALVVLDAVDRGTVSLDQNITASAAVLSDMVEDGSTSNIVPGETMSIRNLLYCILLESANEGCNMLAEGLSGSVQAFVNEMNSKATAIGCLDTNFKNPHGLSEEDHYTTPRDMYLITREALKNELFRQICNTAKYTVPATNVSGPRELSNSNGLINSESKYFPGNFYEFAAGVKTGYTSKAGYCLISTASRENINLMAIVMGGEARDNNGAVVYDNFTDTRKLYDWVFNNFSYVEILSSAELLKEVDVELAAEGEKLVLRPQTGLTALLPSDTDLSVFTFDKQIRIFAYDKGETLRAPISAGEILGEVTLYREGVSYGTVPLVSSAGVELSKIEYIKAALGGALDLFWVKVILVVLILVLLAYFVIVIRYRIMHKRYLNEVRRERQRREELRRRTESMRRDDFGDIRYNEKNKRGRPSRSGRSPQRPRPPGSRRPPEGRTRRRPPEDNNYR